MKQTIDLYQFEQAFRDCNRYDQFGYQGIRVLFDYLEECEASGADEIELDVIALCCDYVHDTIEQIAQAYDIDLSGCADADEKREAVRDYIDYHTSVCGETDDGFVYCTSF